MNIERQTLAPHPLHMGLIDRLLRFPLFYKVLIANSLLVALGAFVGTQISVRAEALLGTSGAGLALLFTVIGVALTVTLNTVIVRAALQPLRTLRATVDAMAQGNLAIRVPESPLADADLASVSSMLNQMIDNLLRYQERVQDLSASVMRAQEGERQRIARELHDQIGQALTLLLVRLKIIEAAPQAEALHGELADLRIAVAATIDQVRRLALDLRPPALDQLGLVPALRELTREYSDRTHIAVTFDGPNEPVDLALDRATALYRIVQEALTNIAKHANAHNVHVSLLAGDTAYQVIVIDDGQGFDFAAIQYTNQDHSGSGLGLFGMEERARLLDGTFKIATRPGAGTTIIALIPKNPLEASHGATDYDIFAQTENYHIAC
jgi:two-component system sensor histidine kinase UhpB